MLDGAISAETGAGNAADWFVDRHVRSGGGDRPAFIDEQRTLSYAGLRDESARFAAGLQRADIRREARIAPAAA